MSRVCRTEDEKGLQIGASGGNGDWAFVSTGCLSEGYKMLTYG